MPWRNKYIVNRRHPLAVAAYLMTGVVGALFVFGVVDSAVISQQLDAIWQVMWEWLMFLGGLGGLAGVFWPRDRLDDALTLEMTGSAMSACGWFTYMIAVSVAVGWSAPAWLVFGVLGLGLVVRSIQTFFDRRKVERIVEKLQTGDPP
jgi:hypothetical protein